MGARLWLLPLILAAGSVRAAEPSLILTPTPADATGWTLADVATIPEADRPFCRHLWIPPWGSDQWVSALNFTVNTACSHAKTIQLGNVAANGWLVRYDLRRLAPDPVKLAKLIETWDSLATQDPYFHVPESNTKLKVAVIAPHVPQDQAALLTGLTLSAGSVYRADWFIVKALSTLNGGKYYEFRQVNRSPEKGTALDNWLSQRGLFVATTQNVGGERRAAMFHSNVTGKPRRVDLFPTLTGGLGSITRDVKDGNIDAKSHPLRNLLNFRDDGSEIIVSQPNGMLDYLLADNKGNIVDEAPPDLVRDHTIPAPYTSRLQPARSCISCHGIEGEDGWRIVTNDVAKLLTSRLNVFADASDTLTPEQVADKLAGFYALPVEHADGLLGRARRDYSTAVYAAAAGIKFEGKSIVADVSQLVTQIIYAYEYQRITPEIAARELGVTLPPDAKGDVLELTLGAPNVNDVVDPVVGFLRIGVPVNRTDFEAVYADMASLSESRRDRSGKK